MTTAATMNPRMQGVYNPSAIPLRLYRSPEGRWIGVAMIQTPVGVLRLSASADEEMIRKVLRMHILKRARAIFAEEKQAAMAGASAGIQELIAHAQARINAGKYSKKGRLFLQRAAAAVQAGQMSEAQYRKVYSLANKFMGRSKGFLKKLGGALSSIAKSVVKPIAGVVKSAVSVVSNLARGRIAAALKSAVSLAKQGLPVVAMAVPGLGVINAQVMTVASSLLARAAKGEPKARNALALNAEAVKRGDPAAIRRAKILAAAALAQRNSRRKMINQRYNTKQELAAMSGQGTWTTAQDGTPVFTPAAMAGGVVWDQLRPHLGYRTGKQSFITTRNAYATGIQALSAMRR